MKTLKELNLNGRFFWKILTIIVFGSILYSCNNSPTSTLSIQSEGEEFLVDEGHSDSSELQLSDNCENVVIGTLKDKNNLKIADLVYEICEHHQTKERDLIYSAGPGSDAFYSASYHQKSVSFRTATFSTEWTSKTQWNYHITAGDTVLSKDSKEPNISTTFKVDDYTKGADVVELYKIKIKRTENLFSPSVPVLSSPSNGQNVPYTSSSRLVWQESDGNPTPTYDINIYSGSYNHTSSTSNTHYSLSSLNLEIGRTYSWRVRAKNSEDESGWSQVRSFTVTPAVSAPVLSSPLNGQNVSYMSSSRLVWEESDGNPTPTYDINIYSGSYNHTSSTPNTHYLLSSLNLETGRTYSWRVRAKNSEGTSSWSQVRTFNLIPWVTISGPVELSRFQGVAYFTANIIGSSPYEYHWESRYSTMGGGGWSNWANAGETQTISYTWSSDVYWREIRLTVTDDNGVVSNTPHHSIHYIH